MIPTRRTWIRHSALLLATFVTATIAGAIFPFGHLPILLDVPVPESASSLVVLLMIPQLYASTVFTAVTTLLSDPATLTGALSFSLSLIFILTCHEAGHYVACRIYRVHATLPYFIPTPPLIGPAGTLGAFIKVLAPMPSRKAMFDIAVAGPIAGFAATILVSFAAFATMGEASTAAVSSGGVQLYFSDPLYMQGLASISGVDLMHVRLNGFYYATWMGLLVTALNLIPAGHLDGGHANYAVFGRRFHRVTGFTAFGLMAAFAIAGFVFFNSPSGFIIAILLGVMAFIGHPSPVSEEPLDLKRKLIGLLTLIIFVICFVPFPIKVIE